MPGPRNLARILAWFAIACPLCTATVRAQQAATQPAASSLPASSASALVWLDDYDAALEQARLLKRPILVRGGAAWCTWCRRLEKELADSRVRAQLSRCTLLYVDIDRSPDLARKLGISGVPALRLLTPFGAQVARQDGYLEAVDLAGWLKRFEEEAALPVSTAFSGENPPDTKALAELLRAFDSRDAVVREAAIRRLLAYPKIAAGEVTESFARGSLAVRLAALELLSAWQAPLADMDPWDPETFTPERLAALRDWAAHPDRITIAAAATRQIAPGDHVSATREIDRLLAAAGEADAAPIRERLARYGEALLPEVYARLAKAATDRDRERLTALRYRLLASGGLAIGWPGGIERLASADPAVRQQAAEQLTSRATPADARLLLELFSNPDPLVREIGLRALHNIGGEQAKQAVVQLLNDPDANVRAAVLKQLAEKPSASLVPQVGEYMDKETDADLLVHAVRLLRETGGEAAVKRLVPMLKHDSWRVRAETAEALGECVKAYNAAIPARVKADAYAALIERLKADDDGFVISRAVTALSGADVTAAVKPLAAAAEKHPDLAMAVMDAMLESSQMRAPAIPHIRKFCTHQDPTVRAAAVSRLCQYSAHDSDSQILAALADADSQVRRAAAEGLFTHLESLRPRNERRTVYSYSTPDRSPGLMSRLFGGRSGRTAAPATASAPATAPDTQPAESEHDRWLARFHEGKGRPAWTRRAVEPLEKMLTADDPDERLPAAVVLAALGGHDKALPVLLETATRTPDRLGELAPALPWLPASSRMDTYRQLQSLTTSLLQAVELGLALSKAADEPAIEQLWVLLARSDVGADTAAQLLDALKEAYFGNTYVSPEEVRPEDRKRVLAVARDKAAAGPDYQRLAALVLLTSASRADAAEMARTVCEDPAVSEVVQQDAFQVQLLNESKGQREKIAAEGLASSRLEIRKISLAYLTTGQEMIQTLRSGIHVYVRGEPEIYYGGSSRAIEVSPPQGVTLEQVRPLLADSDPVVAAQAGYLLVLLGDLDGLEPLVRYWRQNASHASDYESHRWTRLVYRAIASANREKHVAVLEEIYARIKDQPWQMREFYWTIRPMAGPRALELRKKIRSEVGMSNLQ